MNPRRTISSISFLVVAVSVLGAPSMPLFAAKKSAHEPLTHQQARLGSGEEGGSREEPSAQATATVASSTGAQDTYDSVGVIDMLFHSILGSVSTHSSSTTPAPSGASTFVGATSSPARSPFSFATSSTTTPAFLPITPTATSSALGRTIALYPGSSLWLPKAILDPYSFSALSAVWTGRLYLVALALALIGVAIVTGVIDPLFSKVPFRRARVFAFGAGRGQKGI